MDLSPSSKLVKTTPDLFWPGGMLPPRSACSLNKADIRRLALFALRILDGSKGNRKRNIQPKIPKLSKRFPTEKWFAEAASNAV